MPTIQFARFWCCLGIPTGNLMVLLLRATGERNKKPSVSLLYVGGCRYACFTRSWRCTTTVQQHKSAWSPSIVRGVQQSHCPCRAYLFLEFLLSFQVDYATVRKCEYISHINLIQTRHYISGKIATVNIIRPYPVVAELGSRDTTSTYGYGVTTSVRCEESQNTVNSFGRAAKSKLWLIRHWGGEAKHNP